MIDSYDSFVYNLVQYLGELGADPIVVRNDALTVDEAVALTPDAVLLSPGPGRPETSGIIGFFSALGVYRAEAGTADVEELDAGRSLGCVPFGVTRPPPDFRFGGAIGE